MLKELHKFDNDLLNQLQEKINPPYFMKEIFTLAQIGRKLRSSLSPFQRYSEEVLAEWIQNIDSVIALAKNFPVLDIVGIGGKSYRETDSYIIKLLNSIFLNWNNQVTKQNIEKVIKLVSVIENSQMKKKAYVMLATALTQAGYVDQAFLIAIIPSHSFKLQIHLLFKIINVLDSSNRIDEAINPILKLPEKMSQFALIEIVKSFCIDGNINKANEVILMLNNTSKDFALLRIAKFYLRNNQFDEAFELSKEFFEIRLKYKLMHKIVDAAIAAKNAKMAIKAAKMLPVSFAISRLTMIQFHFNVKGIQTRIDKLRQKEFKEEKLGICIRDISFPNRKTLFIFTNNTV